MLRIKKLLFHSFLLSLSLLNIFLSLNIKVIINISSKKRKKNEIIGILWMKKIRLFSRNLYANYRISKCKIKRIL